MAEMRVGGGVSPDPVTKAVLDALGTNYVVERGEVQSQYDPAQKVYYRRWSNGLIEQWSGETVSGRKTYTFPIAFSDTNYCLIGGYFIQGVAGCRFVDKTETSFTHDQSAYNTEFFGWYACGY